MRPSIAGRRNIVRAGWAAALLVAGLGGPGDAAAADSAITSGRAVIIDDDAEDRQLRLRRALDDLRRRKAAENRATSRAAARARTQPQPVTGPGPVLGPAPTGGAPGDSPAGGRDDGASARHRWATPVHPPRADATAQDGDQALENERFRWMPAPVR